MTTTATKTAIRINGELNTDTFVMGGLIGTAGVAIAGPTYGGGLAQVVWRGYVPVYYNCSDDTGTGHHGGGNTIYMNPGPGCVVFGYVIAP